MTKTSLLFFGLIYLFSNICLSNSYSYFKEVEIALDTGVYTLSKNTVYHQRKQQICFEYNNRYAVAELRFFLRGNKNIEHLNLLPSANYTILDSLIFIEPDNCYRGVILFSDLNTSSQISFLLNAITDTTSAKSINLELPVFPYTKTWARIFPSTDIIFVGEEKSFEIETNNPENIKINSDWQIVNGVDYRITQRDGQLLLLLQPREIGVKNLKIQLETTSPFFEDNEFKYHCPLVVPAFTIKASRLHFLNFDRKEITYDDESRQQGVLISVNNHRRLQLNRTYRIENQEGFGGMLVGELATLKDLSNDKILCKFTPFNLHRQNLGYLYLKYNDTPVFMCNIDITPKTNIKNIWILHEGGDWINSVKVNPGEVVDIVVEGEALHKARFSWQDAIDITSDTINQTEKRRIFKLRIPMTINKRLITLLNNGQPTGKHLVVEEYQNPRPFDFITLNYGKKSAIQLNKINDFIISRENLTNFSFSFNRSEIDERVKLYGKQFLDIDVRILGRKGEIMELRSLKNQVVCPDETSPRGAFYKDKQCVVEDLNLNRILSNKTNSLENFGKVQLEVRHSSEKYTVPTLEKRVEVIYQPAIVFDIDLSLPAGMMIQNLGQTSSEKTALEDYNKEVEVWKDVFQEWVDAGGDPTTKPGYPQRPKKSSFTDNLGGISIALIAQFSFPDREKPGKLKPFRAGAGFLFINTFNFSDDAKRDLALVVLGSIYPLGNRRMFNVPIHIGFGYKFQDKIPFVMISPGISVSF
ncbi:MAG: hypothetical protein ACRCSB_04900 [Bacteroidales bacterium]